MFQNKFVKVLVLLVIASMMTVIAPTTRNANAAVPVSSKRIVGYFTQWSIYKRAYYVGTMAKSGAAERMTHVNYAFSDISTTYKCATADAFADWNKAFSATESVDGTADVSTQKLKGNFNQLRELKLKYPHLKIIMSIGGWTLSTNFSQAAMPANRAAFVASCIDMYLKGNFDPANGIVGFPGIFDGIDLDWEYPGACGNTCNFSPDDTANFTALIAEFRNQMTALTQTTGQTYLLTAATSADDVISSHIDLPSVAPNMDWINIMTYDFHGAWDARTNMHSPLYGDPADPDYAKHYWSDNAVSLYISRGMPASKLTMGVPFYARGWGGVPPGPNGDGLYQVAGGRAPRGKYENGIDDYKEMIAREATFTKYYHPIAKSVYIYNGSTFWTYDDPQSMAGKMDYIKSKGLSGVMFWSVDGDTSNIALLSAIYNGLNSGTIPPTSTPAPVTNTPVPPTATKTNTPVPPTATSIVPTNTSAPPTATSSVPTNTPAPATNTPVPPTKTNTPVAPTATSIPPTSTPAPTSSGGNTGYHSPSAQAAGSGGHANGFEINPTNAFADDSTYATDVDSGTLGSLNCTDPTRDNHDFSGYGFALPTGSVVTGIEVRLDALVDRAMNTASMCVQLSADGGATWTTAKVTPALTTTEATYILGGATDTWGRTWSATDLSNANFKVRVTDIANATVRDFSLDWVAVKVYSN